MDQIWDIDVPCYDSILSQGGPRPPCVVLRDYINGFDSTLNNKILDHLQHLEGPKSKVRWGMPWHPTVIKNYPELELIIDHDLCEDYLYKPLYSYTEHPPVNIDRFVCSFNGSGHVGRRLLTSAMRKLNLFDAVSCTKNFAYDAIDIDGHINDYADEQHARFLSKFIVSRDPDFDKSFYSIDDWSKNRFAHESNIERLAPIVTRCFLHLVSESWSHSYQPFVTEKFLYSVLNRGLFLAYAQPAWHHVLRDFYGFKWYSTIFNYDFDLVTDPVTRLYKLLMEIQKFRTLTSDDWRDLYLMESDVIEYNYDHFMSRTFYKVATENASLGLLEAASHDFRDWLEKYR
jgi:hypothetical protein